MRMILGTIAILAMLFSISPAFAGSGNSTETESMTNGQGESNASDEGLIHGAVDNCAA